MLFKYSANVFALFSVVVWGSTFVSTKLLLVDLTPVQILLYRTVVAWFFLWMVKPQFNLLRFDRNEALYILASFCGVSLYFVFENYALKYTYASHASFLVTTSPIISAVCSLIIFRKNEFNKRNFSAMLLSLAGVYLLIFSGKGSQMVSPAGDMLALLASVAWSLFAIILSQLKDNLPPVMRIRKVFGYSMLSILFVMYLTGEKIINDKLMSYSCVVNVFYLGAVASALCYFLWNYAVSKIGVSETMIYMYFVPVVTMIMAYFVLSEKITLMMFFSSLIIILGVILFNKYHKVTNS